MSAAWARRDTVLANALLSCRSHFGLVEVHKALTALDSGRNARVEEKTLKRLQYQKTKVSPRKIGKVKSNIDNLKKLKPLVIESSNK